jgi:cobalt-zinc-cadmium efflux system membrane fusion protein
MADQPAAAVDHLPPTKRSQIVGLAVFAAVIVVALVFLVGPSREFLLGFVRSEEARDLKVLEELRRRPPAEFFRDEQGHTGLRYTLEAVQGLHIDPQPVKRATETRPLPPQVGTLQYDNDRLFIIRSRFPGEVAELLELPDADSLSSEKKMRPLRYGDRLKQNQLLAAVWSQALGQAKAALVDAVSNLRLSSKFVEKQTALWLAGNLSESILDASKRQEYLDRNALRTAANSLRMWRLKDDEIEELTRVAMKLAEERDADKIRARSIEDEIKATRNDYAKWARVEIRVPKIIGYPDRKLTVVEKNTHLNDMLDPIASPPMFKLADLRRLTIWVQPQEEYLPLIRDRLKRGIPMSWRIQFQAFPQDAPLDLPILQFAPSLDPTLHTPMVIGYLPNEQGKYVIGQFVTATIYMPPEDDTVEIPTSALNEGEGQSLVFVETNKAKREFTARRVAVVHRFKDYCVVRSKLTEGDQVLSQAEVAMGRRPIEPLLPTEWVVTRGIGEMTTSLETLAVKDRIEKEQQWK